MFQSSLKLTRTIKATGENGACDRMSISEYLGLAICHAVQTRRSLLSRVVERAGGDTSSVRRPLLYPTWQGASPSAVTTGLLDPAGVAAAVVVSAVAGLAGAGTALAIQAGHAVRERGWFPGGVLSVDLHCYDEASVEAGPALDALLRAVGIAAEHIPPGAEERAGLYRSVLAQVGGPVLVIADNTSSEAQVRLLVPGPGPHRVVVTSRRTPGRAAAGCHGPGRGGGGDAAGRGAARRPAR
jgi:hypothetical protein